MSTEDYSAEYIESLLNEAAHYGLVWEVAMFALQSIKTDPTISEYEAIIHGYNEWVK